MYKPIIVIKIENLLRTVNIGKLSCCVPPAIQQIFNLLKGGWGVLPLQITIQQTLNLLRREG